MPITHQEMLAFFTIEQVFPEPHEIELIRIFDRTFLEVQSEEMKKEQKANSKKNK